MTVTFDSSAWIEYFAGAKKGKIIKKIVDGIENIATPSICLMEIKNKYLRDGHEFQDRIDFICSRSLIINIDKDIAMNGADIKNIHKLYTVDSLIYSAAQLQKSTLLTGDSHFKDLKGVELL